MDGRSFGMPARRLVFIGIIAVMALVPFSASATPPDAASCTQNAPLVVTTGTGTIGGAICSIEVQCVTQPCVFEVIGSADGVGSLGPRIYVNHRLHTECGPAVLGCQISMQIPGPGPVRVACDSGASPSVAVAVTVRCSARAL